MEALTYSAFWTHPALHAAPVPKLVTHVMAKVVVPGPALLVAFGAVVVLVTLYTDGVVEAGDGAVMLDGLSFVPRVNHPLVDVPLNQQVLIWMRGNKNIYKGKECLFACRDQKRLFWSKSRSPSRAEALNCMRLLNNTLFQCAVARAFSLLLLSWSFLHRKSSSAYFGAKEEIIRHCNKLGSEGPLRFLKGWKNRERPAVLQQNRGHRLKVTPPEDPFSPLPHPNVYTGPVKGDTCTHCIQRRSIEEV